MFHFAIFLEQNGACPVQQGSHWRCSAPCKHSACHMTYACLHLTTCALWRVAFHGPCQLSSFFQEKESHLCWPKLSSAILLLFKKAKQKAMRWLQMALGSFQENVSIWGLFPTSVCPALTEWRELEVNASLCGNWHALQMSWPFVHWHSIDLLPPLKGKTILLILCRVQSLWLIHLGSRRGVKDALCHPQCWF